MEHQKSAAAVELGRKGGQKTLNLHGKQHYIDMAKKRGKAKKQGGDKRPLQAVGKPSKI